MTKAAPPPPAPVGATTPPPKVDMKGGYWETAKPLGERIGIYGTGGVGKTTLGLSAPGVTAAFDLEHSLPDLKRFDIPVAPNINTFDDIMTSLRDMDRWNGIDNILVNTISEVEKMADKRVRSTISVSDKGGGVKANSLEDYGWGKGDKFLFDAMVEFFEALDAHVAMRRNVILIAHEFIVKRPNPEGDDFIWYAPRLTETNKGPIRSFMKEWCSNVWFMTYMVTAKKSDRMERAAKAVGSDARCIYTTQQPHCLAKSRTLNNIYYPVDAKDDSIWKDLFKS